MAAPCATSMHREFHPPGPCARSGGGSRRMGVADRPRRRLPAGRRRRDPPGRAGTPAGLGRHRHRAQPADPPPGRTSPGPRRPARPAAGRGSADRGRRPADGRHLRGPLRQLLGKWTRSVWSPISAEACEVGVDVQGAPRRGRPGRCPGGLAGPRRGASLCDRLPHRGPACSPRRAAGPRRKQSSRAVGIGLHRAGHRSSRRSPRPGGSGTGAVTDGCRCPSRFPSPASPYRTPLLDEIALVVQRPHRGRHSMSAFEVLRLHSSRRRPNGGTPQITSPSAEGASSLSGRSLAYARRPCTHWSVE